MMARTYIAQYKYDSARSHIVCCTLILKEIGCIARLHDNATHFLPIHLNATMYLSAVKIVG